MMSEERARILRMVANGKLSAEEAAELLEALEPAPRTEARTASLVEPLPVASPTGARTLVINITEGGDSKVNVRIPLGLARAAGRFIPRQAQEYLPLVERSRLALKHWRGVVRDVTHGQVV